MTTKAPLVTDLLGDPAPSPTLRALLDIAHLKQLYREGWLRRGIDPRRAESVADHSFGVAALALALTHALRPELDAERVLRMALVHDLGEVHAGDLTPADGVSTRDKHRREAAGVARIASGLTDGDGIGALWDEYEAQTTAEARFVRQLDRLELALQAAIYQLQGGSDLAEFFDSARCDIDDLALLRLLDELEQLAVR